MRNASMRGLMARLAAGIIATLVLSVFMFGGEAGAWSAPTLRAVCAPSGTQLGWTITLPQENDFKIDMAFNSAFTGATTTNFGTAGAHAFTTARGGTTLWVRWSSDHAVNTSAVANTTLCTTGGTGTVAGSQCSGTAAMTSHTAITGAAQGGTASVTFTMSNGCTGKELSLVSYSAPSATFSRDTAGQQVVFDSKTGMYTNGTFTLSVNVPSCFYQVDFVWGAVIAHLGPAGSTNFYGDQGQQIAGVNGGTTACTATTPVGVTTGGNNNVVLGVQTPPSTGAVGPIVTAPIVSAPIIIVPAPGGSTPVAPNTGVNAVQTVPVSGVTSLPSTSTESAPTMPVAALGLAMMALGGLILRRRDTRI
ncbi:MAG: LPXTG cell wall anchor domain-containing protein [Chloroflexota bacterium]|nr:LPXTG cell wall anchor domain-containing protein [Chloroflexota bacterium]